jgi:hypothetical protein
MRARLLVSLVAPLLVLALGEPVWAQFPSSSRQGMFGSRTMGGSITPGNRTFGGTSGLGSSGIGGLGGLGGLGGSSFGSGRTGRGSSGLGSMGIGAAGGGLLGSNERFLRGNRQPGQFVGSDTQDLTNVLGGLSNAATGRGAGQMSRSGLTTQTSGRTARPNQANRRNQGNQRGRGSSRGPSGRGRAEEVVTTVTPDFRYPQPVPANVSSALATRLDKSTRIGRIAPIRVVIEGGTTILRGVVETEHDRALAEQLALLEPGVRRVKNELVVGRTSGSGAAPAGAPAAGPAPPEAGAPAVQPAAAKPSSPGAPRSP